MSDELLLPVSIIAIAFYLFLFVLLVRWLWRAVQQFLTVFGASRGSRFVGLGVVAIIFPSVIYAVFTTPFRLAEIIISPALSAISVYINQPRGEYNTVNYLRPIIDDTVHNVTDLLAALPFPTFFVMVAVWVVMGQVIDFLLHGLKGEPGVGPSSGAIDLYRKIPQTMRKRIALILIFLLGSYLSLAAIVAIPWLRQKDVPDLLTKGRLEQQLKESVLQEQAFDTQFPAEYGSDVSPFRAIDDTLPELIQRSLSPDPSTRAADSQATFGLVRVFIDERKYDRNFLLERWKAMRADVKKAQETNLKVAVDNFETNTQAQMSTQERAEYFKAVSQWYKDGLANVYDRLAGLRKKIEMIDQLWLSWSTDLHSAFAETVVYRDSDTSERIATPPLSEHVRRRIAGYQTDAETTLMNDFRRVADFDTSPAYLPAPPEPGDGWGAFGLVSRWLLRTRSLPIALISGMLGFGLLGAVISSFVRRQLEGQEIASAGDFAGIIIRGFSAAVVVFLAVEGGLAVFTTGEQEPNPYVLFFTCLIGAVFSENVWLWARDKFEEYLKRVKSGSEPGGEGRSRELGSGDGGTSAASGHRPGS